jgi:hypothetical protein
MSALARDLQLGTLASTLFDAACRLTSRALPVGGHMVAFLRECATLWSFFSLIRFDMNKSMSRIRLPVNAILKVQGV